VSVTFAKKIETKKLDLQIKLERKKGRIRFEEKFANVNRRKGIGNRKERNMFGENCTDVYRRKERNMFVENRTGINRRKERK
jgi:hypothetical protein